MIVFSLIYLVGSRLHQLTREHTAPVLVGALTAKPTAALINLVTPSEAVIAIRNHIIGRTSVTIGQGCDGFDGQLLLVSAIAAFPLAWRRKSLGMLLGVLLLYGCNLLRIAGLYYVRRYLPQAFQFVHETVGQTVIIVVGCWFFLLLISHFPPAQAQC
jgi:exosortase family protein XrtM